VRYERVARLGRGGMGVVDLARGPDGEQVALKVLTLHGSADDLARARQRVRREAEVLRQLHHPNVVGLLDVLDDGDELTLVMPYLAGGSLADRVARHGPAPEAEVALLADTLAGALAAAHRAGITHRDIKPANVLYDADGAPHLADFGVARTRDDTVGLTAAGTVVGTPGFMAPEQARGEPAGPAADVFSLGATLLFAATGRGPYGRGAPDLLMVRAARGQLDPVPRSIERPLRRRLQAMLDPRPDRRPSAAALVGGPGGTIAQNPISGGAPKRWRLWMVTGGVGALALLAAVLVAAGETGDSRRPIADTTTTDRACTDLPYQPCGQFAPAPNTDGRACRPGFEDYDDDAVNGCEAEPDGLADGTPLRSSIEGTIVPRDDVDTFSLEVADDRQILCDGRLTVTLTAPARVSLRLELLDGDEVVGQVTSADGVAASVVRREPGCFTDDSTTLTARVSPIGSDRTGEAYLLERHGSY
jgi:hypothetical protein